VFQQVLERGRCRLGFHAGQWGFVSPTECRQERRCPRCQALSAQVVHDWTGWAREDPQTCDLLRRCGRCGEQETSVEHAFDAWTYQAEDACEQRSACSRCGAAGRDRRLAHDWGPWRDSEFYAARVCVCGRCAEMVMTEGEEEDPGRAQSFQAARRALQEVVESPDAATARERIRVHGDLLLGPLGARVVGFSLDQTLHDEDARDTMRRLGELLERCRVEGFDAVFAAATPEPEAAEEEPEAPPPALAASPANRELCGHWRNTEILGSGGFSLTTDTHLILADDGRFRWATSAGEDEQGSWFATPAIISLTFDTGTVLGRRYVHSGNGMTFPEDGRYRYWERL
jgi:hypothetical protein